MPTDFMPAASTADLYDSFLHGEDPMKVSTRNQDINYTACVSQRPFAIQERSRAVVTWTPKLRHLIERHHVKPSEGTETNFSFHQSGQYAMLWPKSSLAMYENASRAGIQAMLRHKAVCVNGLAFLKSVSRRTRFCFTWAYEPPT